jgi:hypothetical protein
MYDKYDNYAYLLAQVQLNADHVKRCVMIDKDISTYTYNGVAQELFLPPFVRRHGDKGYFKIIVPILRFYGENFGVPWNIANAYTLMPDREGYFIAELLVFKKERKHRVGDRALEYDLTMHGHVLRMCVDLFLANWNLQDNVPLSHKVNYYEKFVHEHFTVFLSEDIKHLTEFKCVARYLDSPNVMCRDVINQELWNLYTK